MFWSFSGTFNVDEDIQAFQIELLEPQSVYIVTYSWGGGTQYANPNDETELLYTVPDGGFDPVVSIFNSSGQLIDWQDDASRWDCFQDVDSLVDGIDSGNTYQNLMYDACMNISLDAGTYYAAVSVYDNFPVYSWIDWETFDYNYEEYTFNEWLSADVTVGRICYDTNSIENFCSIDGTSHNGNWSLDILNVDNAFLYDMAVPSTLLLLTTSLLLFKQKVNKLWI
jgi:hypothetical protein